MSLKSHRLQTLRRHLRCNSTILLGPFKSPITNNPRSWIDFMEHATMLQGGSFSNIILKVLCRLHCRLQEGGRYGPIGKLTAAQ